MPRRGTVKNLSAERAFASLGMTRFFFEHPIVTRYHLLILCFVRAQALLTCHDRRSQVSGVFARIVSQSKRQRLAIHIKQFRFREHFLIDYDCFVLAASSLIASRRGKQTALTASGTGKTGQEFIYIRSLFCISENHFCKFLSGRIVELGNLRSSCRINNLSVGQIQQRPDISGRFCGNRVLCQAGIACISHCCQGDAGQETGNILFLVHKFSFLQIMDNRFFIRTQTNTR